MKKRFYISQLRYDYLLEEYGSFFEGEGISLYSYGSDFWGSIDRGDSSLGSVSGIEDEGLVFHIVLVDEDLFFAKVRGCEGLFEFRDYILFILVEGGVVSGAGIGSGAGIFDSFIYERISFPVGRKFFEFLVRGGYTFLSVVWERNFLSRVLRFREEHIEALRQIGKLVYGDFSYKVVIEEFVSVAKGLLSCREIIIYQVEKEVGGTRLSRCIFPYMLAEQFSPLDRRTFAGFVALSGEALSLDRKEDIESYTLTRSHNVLEEIESIMVIPIKDYDRGVYGVVKFINKFKCVGGGGGDLGDLGDRGLVIPFSDYDMELGMSLAPYIAMTIKLNDGGDKKEEIAELTQIGKALATERSHSRLLNFILSKSKDITNCDSGTIYLVESLDGGGSCLRFVHSSLELERKELRLPIDNNSISGYVALTKEVLNIPDAYAVGSGLEYKLNLDYDQKHNYRTKSMLVVPMTNQKDEVTGVIQLINKKRYKDTVLSSLEGFEEEVIPFASHDVDLVIGIAGQAAVAIENNILYNDIEVMLEGFVKASVTAIESRDPTTSGHSERVAQYTVRLASLVSGIASGKWADTRFTRGQIKELKYASLLHDFGKVGVREDVLVKASKLYPYQLDLIKSRFDFIKSTLRNESSERRISYLMERSREEALRFIASEDIMLEEEFKELDRLLALIINANDPLVREGDLSLLSLDELAERTYRDLYGNNCSFLLENELVSLSVRKGSLGFRERKEIESHVTHTFLFLKTIPWTKEFKAVPQIAYAHHEKLDGSGYPRGISEVDIPVQSMIMMISDIYDALVSGDRPYKERLREVQALDILHREVENNHIDAELVRIFVEGKVYKLS